MSVLLLETKNLLQRLILINWRGISNIPHILTYFEPGFVPVVAFTRSLLE